MDTLITAIVSIIAGAIINELIRFFVPVWKRKIKNTVPKRKSIRDRIRLAIKYPFFIAAYFFVFKYVCFGKWFVVAFILITVLMTVFIAWDVFFYSLRFAAYYAEKDRLKGQMDMWTNQLAICDSNDTERQKMILEKIEALRLESEKI